MKNRPFITGIIAAASPIPLFCFSVLWCWIWGFGIGMGLLHYDTIPLWIGICEILPLFISPALGVIGIVHSLVKIKTRLSWLGILLSVLGLISNGLLFYCLYYLARF